MKKLCCNIYRHLRIHYPLALPYSGKPDPVLLRETIRALQTELEKSKKQVQCCAAVRMLLVVTLCCLSAAGTEAFSILSTAKRVSVTDSFFFFVAAANY